MKLTGKAKEDFNKWLIEQYPIVRNINITEDKLFVSLGKALIIEWFDSVGIYISINYDSFNEEFIYLIDGYHLGSEETRTQATNSVIKIANDNYNKN